MAWTIKFLDQLLENPETEQVSNSFLSQAQTVGPDPVWSLISFIHLLSVVSILRVAFPNEDLGINASQLTSKEKHVRNWGKVARWHNGQNNIERSKFCLDLVSLALHFHHHHPHPSPPALRFSLGHLYTGHWEPENKTALYHLPGTHRQQNRVPWWIQQESLM